MSNSPVGVRIATEEDMRFVASTWFHSVLRSGVTVNQMPFGIFRDGMEANIQALLKRSITRVAFARETPEEILGYAVIDAGAPNLRHAPTGPVCHHIYTKSAYRRQGVARSLLGEVKTYTHPATPGSGKKFATALGLQYNPRLG